MTEYEIENGKIKFKHRQPAEPLGFIDYIKGKKEDKLYIINGYLRHLSIPKINVYDVNEEKEVMIDLRDIDAIMFGFFTHFFENLGPFNDFLEYVKIYNIKSVNSVDIIRQNMTKQYLIDLKRKDKLPIPSTKIVNNIETLLKLPEDEKYLVKPIISERAKSTVVISDMDMEEIEKYFNEHNGKIIGGVEQKILLQYFNEDFLNYGEYKICVVRGEISIARRTVPPKNPKSSQIISTSNGSTMEKHIPDTEQSKICLKVYEVFNEVYGPTDYIRVDLVGHEDHYEISEIEAINPDLITCYGYHTEEDYKDLYDKLYDCLKN